MGGLFCIKDLQKPMKDVIQEKRCKELIYTSQINPLSMERLTVFVLTGKDMYHQKKIC